MLFIYSQHAKPKSQIACKLLPAAKSVTTTATFPTAKCIAAASGIFGQFGTGAGLLQKTYLSDDIFKKQILISSIARAL